MMVGQLLLRAGRGVFPRYARIATTKLCPVVNHQSIDQVSPPPQGLQLCVQSNCVGYLYSHQTRQYCTGETKDTLSEDSNPDGTFKQLYKNPNVNYIKVIQAAKLTILSITPFWILAFSAVTGRMSSTILGSFFFIFSSIALLEAGKFASHLACSVHVNDTTKKVKITHFDFMGRMKDVLVDLDQVVTESTDTKARIYLKPNENDKFLLYLNLTTPEQREVLTTYFGDLYK